MIQSQITFQTLAEKEVRLREEGKRKRAEKTHKKRDSKLRPLPTIDKITKGLKRLIKIQPYGCWEWMGSLDDCGYGKCSRFGGETLAHRMSWIVFRGSIINKMYVCHHCDNPPCINPDHLFLGTQRHNMHDCYLKNRSNHARGERVNTAKMSEKDIMFIRQYHSERMVNTRVKSGTLTYLAERFGVHKTTIISAIRGSSWSHVTQSPPS
jgi:hypothetical protein